MRKSKPNERSDGIFGLGKVDELCYLAHMGKLKEERIYFTLQRWIVPWEDLSTE